MVDASGLFVVSIIAKHAKEGMLGLLTGESMRFCDKEGTERLPYSPNAQVVSFKLYLAENISRITTHTIRTGPLKYHSWWRTWSSTSSGAVHQAAARAHHHG
ncbi:uncharacterized protein [Physcomitrium patens]|uniref:uncharacterized protein n=1 Tax=Physcomitrium patens TaxID=3218 RepID=UPI000D1510B9|nr:uncharacterized protein LOC112294330 isoform X1 [Physcomitrium patens]|eukprot:XP_024400404.1 uncharacterized protein LOC112294330 isoform X1 [Physcomitrella patens]